MKYVESIIDFFENNHVKTIFSYPGEQILPLYRKLHENSNIKCIDVKHEQSSAHAADGYFRITNKTGICLSTAGPGATNLTTGIATAFKDSSSIIAITGRCDKKYIGKNYFQELPMEFLNFSSGYFTKVADLCYFKEAFTNSKNLKKPIQINIPSNMYYENTITSKMNLDECFDNCKIETALNDIKKHEHSKNPVLLIGQGIYGNLSYNEIGDLNDILKNLEMPIVTTYPARGVVDESLENCFGLIGRRGNSVSNCALLSADTIFSIGSSFSYNTLFESIRDKILYKVVPLNFGINSTSNISTIVNSFNETFSKALKTDFPDLRHNKFQFGDYSNKINEILVNLPDNAIITTDAGNHTVFVSLLKKCVAPKNIISSHSMGTMGFGLSASIGVKFGCLDYNINREVISISGDGGFSMNIQELGTVFENNLKILIIVMKNNHLNMFGRIKNPDFNKIADAYGIDSVYIQNADEICENVHYFLKNNKPYVMVVECENEKLPKPFI
ncbi:thiamine pyrophosphate protein domain protein TPP-binding [Methanococcus vannielii SB]|uniref:Thiamine pyrophosphate protein domain protein TPP-binding n=1 Tax=Methanococcus vannielii (strain ATCC 35089 / DSM 1224 / JCM 13029 / OCM 148 / SB) TaxID=406327 RepID=A6URC4_METVS|nr:thiamine pyrophosphate-binding protein [Methanococcus vannielii]ABR55046.1 thiamine pyrophosphate protein domain protein TPP-binding [Methanococcus vannielii SB]